MTSGTLTACPFCDHERAVLIEAGQPMRGDGRWDIYCCGECGCYYPRPRLGQTESLRDLEQLNQRVQAAGERGRDPKASFPPETLVWRLKRLVTPVAWPLDARHFLRRHLNPGGLALDLGAADGKFCFLLEKVGYRAFGLEPQGTLASRARGHGLQVHTGYFPDAVPAEISGHAYDLISCMESIMYFVDIRRALSTIYAMLKPDGHLLVKSLNAHSTYFDITGNAFASRYGNHAQAMPTLRSLRYWMDKCGFDVVTTTGGMWPVPPAGGAIRSTMTALGNKLRSMTIFGMPLFDLDKTEALLILAKKRGS